MHFSAAFDCDDVIEVSEEEGNSDLEKKLRSVLRVAKMVEKIF
jgi:hypothetical protein